MGIKAILSGFLAMILAACGGGGSFSLSITFPDEQAREQTREISVVAVDATGGATCQALIDDMAIPGDSGFPVEASLRFDYPVSGNPGALDLSAEGLKLFFAEGFDDQGTAILRGCTLVTADGSADSKVTIELVWVETGCQNDNDCPDDDNLWCNGYQACQAGDCVPVVPDCDDQVACTADACDEDADTCTNTADDTLCDNLDFCDGVETCDSLSGCQAGTPACDDGVECTVDSCDEDSGTCNAVADDGACDDGSFCTGVETCDALTGCQIGSDPCGDGVGCTADTCDEALDICENAPQDALCDDGNVCNGDETCDALTDCQAGQALVCDDGDFCNGAESCDPVNGCGGGPVPDCNDGVPCTADACSQVENACEHTPNAGGCLDVHIGPAAGRCPHQLADGTDVTTCDYTGRDAVVNAMLAASVDGARFLLYDDGGSLYLYNGHAEVPGQSWIGAASGVDPANVGISSSGMDNGAIQLMGDNVHVEGLSLVVLAGAEGAISSWPTDQNQLGATTGHLIERVSAWAMDPEVIGSNSIGPPVLLADDCTVRNSHFYGQFEMRVEAMGTSNMRFVNNTFALFDPLDSTLDVIGSQGFVFANNVVLAMGADQQVLIVGDLSTTSFNGTGNLMEGLAGLVAGLAPGDVTNQVHDNLLALAEMESPLVPIFLADSAQAPTISYPGEGFSLDGVDLSGRTDILPGAFQNRSALSLPRRDTITVGRGTCGGGPCDLDADLVDNEIQFAVWSAWPDAQVEVYPDPAPYSGFATIGWPVTLRGMGNLPEEVVLQNIEEHPTLDFYNVYDRHDATIVLLTNIQGSVQLLNFTLLIDTTGVGDNEGIYVEAREAEWDLPPHQLRRLRIEEFGGSTGIFHGAWVGARTLVQDVLVHGRFQGCVGFGPRRTDNLETIPTNSKVVNLTCRQTGTGATAPESVFDVASVDGAVFVNVVAELSLPAPLFRAQRRSAGDADAIALDFPASFTAEAITILGMSTLYDGFTDAQGTYSVVGLVELGAADPLFVSVDDSHLDPACTAIDTGVDPATVHADLQAGISLDAIDHNGQVIDRGCYEQGQ